MPPIRNPYKKVKQVKNNPIVVVHMPNNPNCVCRKCSRKVDAAACAALASANAVQFEDSPSPPTLAGNVAIDNQGFWFPQGLDPVPPFASAATAFADLPASTHAPNATTPTRARPPNDNGTPSQNNTGPTNTIAVAFVTPERGSSNSIIHANQKFFQVATFGSATGNAGKREAVATCCSLVAAGSHLSFVSARTKEEAPSKSGGEAFIEDSLGDLESLGIATADMTTSTHQVFSEVVNNCLLSPLAQIGVHSLSTAASHCPRDEQTEGNTRLVDKNHKGCFFFTPLMIRDKKLSLINPENKHEFIAGPQGAKAFNRSFWKDSLMIKRTKPGGMFSSIEIGAHIPDWSIADCFQEEHKDAMEWMTNNCAAFPNNNTLFLSLKNEYATVFLRNMESPVVAKARLSGFRPLFLIKNAIVQQTDMFGINGWQVTSINLKPKTFLALIGFFKGTGDNLQLITLQHKDKHNFMVIDNRSHL